MVWNPFSTSPTRSAHSSRPRSNYARSSTGSTYSSSHRAPTSRYGRQPRDGYLQSLYRKLRQLWRDLLHYARRHPYKVFFAVVMPLLSGGVLHKLARRFGVNLPEMGSQGARGGFSGRGHRDYDGGGGYYGSEGYGAGASRGGTAGGGQGGVFGGLDVQSVAGGIGNLASLAQMASKFM
ncbi:hypothetical protein EKO04_009365 [Ascochyta lentis]|uniref:Uncharacterized protein n=1 Tax=Ascochyta lentis TaxID=205686 RepID=A0A8H7MER1_9PLEO|nr:hypothetical protein EKO04_009365 [Ascochyta lentis]